MVGVGWRLAVSKLIESGPISPTGIFKECKMVRMALLAISLMGLFLSPFVWAESEACPKIPYFGDLYSSDPTALAVAWLPSIEHLYSAIPTLSPQEKRWLENEMTQSDLNRWKRAHNSREYAIQEAKQNVGSLLGDLRVLAKVVKPEKPRSPVEDWGLFVYTLIDQDAASYLASLVSDGVIQRGALPEAWNVSEGMGISTQKWIVSRRVSLARHILICVLPKVAR